MSEGRVIALRSELVATLIAENHFYLQLHFLLLLLYI